MKRFVMALCGVGFLISSLSAMEAENSKQPCFISPFVQKMERPENLAAMPKDVPMKHGIKHSPVYLTVARFLASSAQKSKK